jgi:hypothetical protein
MTSRTGTTGPATTTAPASPQTGNTVAPAGNTVANRPAGASDARSYPDHAVLPNATKDQLQNAPQFRYGTAR